MTSWAKFKEHSNLPNAVSVLRAVMGLLIPFFFLAPHRNWHIAGGIFYTAAAITDWLDGWLARRDGLVSDVGKILDPTADKILTLVTMAIFSYMGFFSPWWLVPIFAREIVITFCRMGWILEGQAAGAEKLGKIKLVVQVILIASPFAELMTQDFASISKYREFFHNSTYFLLVLTNFITLLSGYTFVRSNHQLFRSPAFAKYVSATGVGLIPGPAGTWGSLLGLILILMVAWNVWLFVLTFAFLFWAGLWSVGRLDLSKVKDPHFVVIDEVLGMFVTMIFVPITPLNLAAGFFLFRFFDIVKPFPCRRLEKIPGFWGITLDDLGAGVYSCLVLHFFFV